MTVHEVVPSFDEVGRVAEESALFVDRAPGYAGESPWEYQRGVAEALRWLQGAGPRPDDVAWCDFCGGAGVSGLPSVDEVPCDRCAGSGLAP